MIYSLTNIEKKQYKLLNLNTLNKYKVTISTYPHSYNIYIIPLFFNKRKEYINSTNGNVKIL